MSPRNPLPACRVVLAAIVVTLLSLGGLLALSPQAQAATTSTLRGVQSGKCANVDHASLTPGAAVLLYTCIDSAVNEQWTLTPAGELRVYGTQRCLDITGNDRAAGAVLESWTCNGGANQHWSLGTGHRIVSALTGYCLDVLNNATANNSRISVWPCNGGTNQQWTTSFGTVDAAPPSVPADPRVSNLTCDSVTFAWNAASDNVGVTAYDVYHDGQLIKTVSGTTLSTSLTVVPGAKWGLYVNARDAAGNVSQASSTVPIAPPQCQVDTQKPSAPTGLQAAPSGTSVSLSWTAATDNIGVRAYDVLRGGTKVGTVSGTASAAPATTFVDSGLTANTAYTYTVTARDAAGNTSAASAPVSTTTGAACGAVCGVAQVATDTDIPWGLTTLPNGDVLYTRRDAHTIVQLNTTTGVKTTVGTVPGVDETDGEGGLLGLAISPTYASDHWLYLMHTSSTDNRVVRIKLNGTTLDTASEQVLLKGILRNKYHNGGRLRFGPDGKLYVATGDAQNGDNAQNKASLNGKILRINADGTVPSDNPFGTAVWSYGHRNPQGLAFDSQGRLWEQEFGNSVMDETNLITKGGNYGWPACEGTSGTCGTAGYIAPKHTYPTADGSCSGIAIVKDVLYVACERGTRMYREVISGTSLTNVQVLFNGTYGRLRTVEPAPGNALWLTTSNEGDKDSIADNSNERIFKVSLGD